MALAHEFWELVGWVGLPVPRPQQSDILDGMRLLFVTLMVAASLMAQECLNNCGQFQGECMSCHITEGPRSQPPESYTGPYCSDCWYCASIGKPAPLPQFKAGAALLESIAKYLPVIHKPKAEPANHAFLMRRAIALGLPRGFKPETLALIRVDADRWR